MRADGWIVALLSVAIAGCVNRAEGPRPIAVGTPCVQCGMRVEDLRFACEQERLGAYRVYDSIECLLKADAPSDHTWLADYDTRTLHAAESVKDVQIGLTRVLTECLHGVADELDR